ncbi:MAG TPA: cob(I)yrinic acid a,c-diamide adenosyltransferase [Chloroflexota bacterium]|nr:cob(I)yrinic acid a,c-diamide adenosyltransferase [Chloroflexota bacterium]
MKIYTRAGDSGSTALFGGARIAKDALRVEAYGTIDELNACLGVAIAALSEAAAELRPVLLRLQSELFDLGAELAISPERRHDKLVARLATIGSEHVAAHEQIIDHYEELLAPLRSFILPGGSPAAASLHHARTVARRAERRIVSLAAQEPVSAELLRYSNRLSDLLFVLARTANRLEGLEDVPWTARHPGALAE